MNWYEKVCKFSARHKMNYVDALKVFGFDLNSRPTNEEIKARYRKLAILLHPDKPGGDESKFIELNNANESLMAGTSRMPHSTPRYRAEEYKERPKWQTDYGSNYNEVRDDLHDINWAKKTIHEYSEERGPTSRWMIWAHDGAFFRHGATFMTNKESLAYAAKVAAYWNSNGGSSHPSEAIVAAEESNSQIWTVVQLKGKSVIDKNITFECDGMPWNDRKCNQFMQDLINGVDLTA